MSSKGMLWLSAGFWMLGILLVLAQAQRSWPVEIVPPPPRPAPPAHAIEPATPSLPPPQLFPKLVPPSHLPPTDAIVWQMREICGLLKREATAMEIATRLGTITHGEHDEGAGDNLVIRPANPYFSRATVFREGSLADSRRDYETTRLVGLELTDSAQLSTSALISAFGKGREDTDFHMPFARHMYFPLRPEPSDAPHCDIGADEDWRKGAKKGAVMRVSLGR